MTTSLFFASTTPHLKSHHHLSIIFSPNYNGKLNKTRCIRERPTSNSSSSKRESEPENALLKVAWYSSELLGIAASFFRSPSNSSTEASEKDIKLGKDVSGAIDRAVVVETIKEDFQKSYFVTGSLTLEAYEENCEFADPAGSFEGLQRFKRNCTNFGLLIEKSNMKLTKWEDFEDKGIGHWRFSCVMSFPWKPILSATGYTEYYFDEQSGRVCRHVEHWNVPKMALLKQLLKPSQVFMILMYIFETYLDLRQHAALKLPTLPKTLKGVISQEKFEKSRAYSLDKSHFNFVHEFVTILLDSAILFYGILPWFWKKSGSFLVLVGLNEENEIFHTLAFLAGVMIWSQITDLPFSLYSTFVIEARHGFNKQTTWLFFRDLFKGICLAILLGPPIVSAIILIVQLPEGELREKIEKLASFLHFPLKKLFVVDGSTRSSHSNAYMYGFFKNKRIVLYDTLIQQCKNDEEIVAVIAHELGHWKLNHTMYSFIAVQILTFLQFGGYTLVRNSTDLFRSFGFDTQPVLIGLIIFQHSVIPLQHLVSFGLNLVSRAFEFQADAFAKKLGYGSALRAGLVKLQEENLSSMNTDPWYSAYHYSHPPLVERLAAIGEPDKKAD
ncbi:hypothetical protein SADUNF_Sadunf02G0135800 [Salix dunnii]|uniref:CAAX prenyl protease 1 homolog n=1 Tax=Salix dunnii TaxID=1413687 RepID=A0A835N7R8_9ROSI|nr:hypothetical protein SADUNF_Sadunf02G0135800 [Salix dunnii]